MEDRESRSFLISAMNSADSRNAGVSWQGDLFGFLAGVGAARLMFPKGKTMLG
jgi:membrane associated rhomboid family serine protease